MSGPLVLALPSKGRLKEQVDAWLADAGFALQAAGGARGYAATLSNLPGVEVRLLSASDIAGALATGEAHLGVTGEDLLRERGALDAAAMLLLPLGFGHADLVVAAPRSWPDVDRMADVAAVAHDVLTHTGRRLRVATKFTTLTRAFFARHGVTEYRIVESMGATEGAPAAGAAELVVDITTTGATLEANGLKMLDDGLIVRSQAQLAASLTASWTAAMLADARRLLLTLEARVRARTMSTLSWPAHQDAQARDAVRAIVGDDGWRSDGALIRSAAVMDATTALADAGVGPVAVESPVYVFSPASDGVETLTRQVFDGLAQN